MALLAHSHPGWGGGGVEGGAHSHNRQPKGTTFLSFSCHIPQAMQKLQLRIRGHNVYTLC
jgi:hypothetical protein